MVGVPGRSKACVTCRKRRKGCDFGRPTCAQCRKHELQCGGYESQRVFVVSTPEARQPGYSAGDTSKAHRRICPANNVWPTVTNLQQLSRPEDERRCIDLFWETYFPSGRPIPHPAIRSYTCTWTETARNSWQDEDTLRFALWANSLLMAGRRHQEEWMVRESSKMYGKALAELRKSLSASRGVNKEASIATVKLLSMFEALVQQEQSSSQPTDWQRHNAGELALFVARKPESHQDGDAHYIFADERVEMALSSILQRKKLVLSDPSWKTVPWKVTPKNLKDVLVDVLVDMPGLVEEFDAMIQSLRDLESHITSSAQQDAAVISAATLRDGFLQKCWEGDRQLLDWSQHGLDNHGQDLVIQIAQVHGMSLYWTTALVLYTMMQAASNLCLSFEPRPIKIPVDSSPTRLAPGQEVPFFVDRLNPLSHANKLVDALSILLQPSARLYGQRSAALPLEVALHGNGISREQILVKLQRLKKQLDKGFA
ncbi:Sterigmatocystin biosynthesis regulatory protein [Rhypophila decipiens]|uniref:Sterigmatocystin biosynthesis regulatory protein n=1 Tax=Rhypophila decipiens TaxID=261697 RepID=A0AAN6XV66_9PEZI|nr:Sterigmatocystin biosynthesis regulatory protein [Rhypophila decipiens]